jgi:hypothetical protein
MPRTISLPKNNTAIVQDGNTDEQAIVYWKSQRPDIFLPDAPPPEPAKPEPGAATKAKQAESNKPPVPVTGK